MADWQPENIFHDKVDGVYNGVRFVFDALRDYPIKDNKTIVTSRDPGMREVQDRLRRRDMPEGVEKWQLPIIIGGQRPAFMFITVCHPSAIVPKHSHLDDTITRVIMSGSVFLGDKELTQGDWFFVPPKVPYSYSAGMFGAVILHIYNGAGGIVAYGFPGGEPPA
jgi:hypothetical protein